MRYTMKLCGCAAALGAALLIGGCASSGSSSDESVADAGPGVAETGGNIAVQAAASESMKKGGVGGSLGYGLQSQGHNLSRALFGRKKTSPKHPAPPQQTPATVQ